VPHLGFEADREGLFGERLHGGCRAFAEGAAIGTGPARPDAARAASIGTGWVQSGGFGIKRRSTRDHGRTTDDRPSREAPSKIVENKEFYHVVALLRHSCANPVCGGAFLCMGSAAVL
jgi:hypothetical protein